MISTYIRRVLFIFICCICFSFYSKAQVLKQDSVVSKQEEVKQIGYATQPAWMVSGSVSAIKGTDLLNTFTTDLGNMLYGKISGLTVRQGGAEPGLDGSAMNSRGVNTYGTGTGVLIIVDGFESSYNNLVPYEIESMTLLKDASATAMYGSLGANGVLLVTTKRGKAGKLKVNFSVQKGFSSPTHLPKFLGSYDYATLYNEGLVNDGKPEKYTATVLDAYKNRTDPFLYPDVNWYNELLRKSVPLSNYDMNFSGGDNSIRYFVMMNMIKADGLYIKSGDQSTNSINSNFTRFNFRANVDINIGKRLLASVTVGGSVEEKDNPAANTTGTIFNNMATIPPNAFPVYNPNGTIGASLLFSNPLGDILNKGFFTSNSRTLQTTMSLTEQLDFITPGLSIKSAISFNNYFTYYSNKSRDYGRYSMVQNTVGDIVYSLIGQNTSLASDESQSSVWRNFGVKAFLNYDRTFGINKVSAVLMFNRSNYSLGTGELPYQNAGMFGRFSYAKNEKYIGEFSFGYDGNENFKKGSQYGFFPAGSLAWVASKESFLKDSKIINFLKIRGSYGLTGNDNIGGRRFLYDQIYQGAAAYYVGQTTNTSSSTMLEGQIANPNPTWEKQKQMNFGLEASIMNRLDLSFDIFNQDRYDILALPYATLPQISGMSFPNLNVGKTNNKGFEAMVRFNSDQKKAFQYFVQADLWYAQNKIVFNSEAMQVNDWLYTSGHQIGQSFLYECVGFFKDAADIAASPTQLFQQVVPGDLKYKDQNGDGNINQQDLYPLGNTYIPPLTASVHLGFNYKGFDLDMIFQGVNGRTIYLSGNYFAAFQNNGKISEIALGRWTPATAATATYPRLSASNDLNNYKGSSFWQRN